MVKLLKKILLGLVAALILIFLIVCAIGTIPDPIPKIPPGLKGQMLDANGSQIRYYQAGQGPDILFMHACPGSIEDFDPLLGELSKKYRVTAFDRPGHGYSEDNVDRFDLNYYADSAEAVIENLGLKDVVVVGHSYGSAVALTLAIRDSPNIKSYIVMASPGYRPVDIDPITRILGIPYFGKGFVRVLRPFIGDRLIRAGIKRGWDPDQATLSESDIELRVKMWGQPKVPVARAHELLNLGDNLEENSYRYADIKKRVVIVQGKKDIITRAAWRLKYNIPGAEIILFDGVGHYPQYARPKEVIEIIERERERKP